MVLKEMIFTRFNWVQLISYKKVKLMLYNKNLLNLSILFKRLKSLMINISRIFQIFNGREFNHQEKNTAQEQVMNALYIKIKYTYSEELTRMIDRTTFTLIIFILLNGINFFLKVIYLLLDLELEVWLLKIDYTFLGATLNKVENTITIFLDMIWLEKDGNLYCL